MPGRLEAGPGTGRPVSWLLATTSLRPHGIPSSSVAQIRPEPTSGAATPLPDFREFVLQRDRYQLGDVQVAFFRDLGDCGSFCWAHVEVNRRRVLNLSAPALTDRGREWPYRLGGLRFVGFDQPRVAGPEGLDDRFAHRHGLAGLAQRR